VSAIRESDALHARARAFVDAFEARAPMPETFDALACDLVRFQAKHVPGYARLCAARGFDPSIAKSASEAPAVPTDAFKLARVFAFDEREACVMFRTSGTTIGARGAHAMRVTTTYDHAALAFGRWALADDLDEEPEVIVLAPSQREAPDSSLSHMLTLFARDIAPAIATDAETYFFREGSLDVRALEARIDALEHPGLVCGTSFAFVHLLDALGGAKRLALPRGSRVMQTGGFKGKSREVDARALRAELARVFDVGERAIVCEYGMTELSSQFYEATLADAGAGHGVYVEPPWARVVPVDPETLAPMRDGDVGIARIHDLMNVDSAFAVLAADRVRRVDGGFELLGRAPGAPPRGCSIAIDEIVGRSR
jgi:hypothetical protein